MRRQLTKLYSDPSALEQSLQDLATATDQDYLKSSRREEIETDQHEIIRSSAGHALATWKSSFGPRVYGINDDPLPKLPIELNEYERVLLRHCMFPPSLVS